MRARARTVEKFKAVIEERASDDADQFAIVKAGNWVLDVDLEKLGRQPVRYECLQSQRAELEQFVDALESRTAQHQVRSVSI